MLLIPCTWIEPSPAPPGAPIPATRKPNLRQAVFDADSGMIYVETAADVVTVITANGVQLSFKSSLADWINKLIATAAADDGADNQDQET
jgi:hypothetical protein